MSGPRVSVLTPTYNHSRFLDQAIQSVRDQEFSDWEMVVVDDGSTDDTVRLAESVGDPRIRVLREPHRGIERLAETYNRGLAECNGELIAILEGDDAWPLGKLARQVPDFEDPEVVLSAGQVQLTDGKLQPTRLLDYAHVPADAKRNEPVGRASVRMLSHQVQTFTWPCTVVVRKSALQRIGGFRQDQRLPVVDFPTLLALGLEGRWVWHDKVLGFWRRHGSSTTSSHFASMIEPSHALAHEFAEANMDRLPFLEGEWAEIQRETGSFLANRTALLARRLAHEKMWHDAHQAFAMAAFGAGPKSAKLYQIAAILCRLHLNPEFLMLKAGRRPWKEEAQLESGDWLI